MDTLTHALLGAVTSHLGFRQKIGREAPYLAAVAANLPDLDIFLRPLSRWLGGHDNDLGAMFVHRGLTHSLLAVPVLVLPIALVWWCVRRHMSSRPPAVQLLPAVPVDTVSHPEALARRAVPPWLPPYRPRPPAFALLYACLMVACVTHCLLDSCTSYGTQLLLPFSDTRYAFDAVPIVDLIFTALLAGGLVACRLKRRSAQGVRRAALITCLLAAGYLGAGRVMHDRAIDQTLPQAKGDLVISADAYPAPLSIFLWRAVLETNNQWIVARVRPMRTSGPTVTRGSAIWRTSDNPLIEKARALPEVAGFYKASMGRIRVSYADTGSRRIVEFHDMRYGAHPESIVTLWSLRAIFDEQGKLLETGKLYDDRANNWRSRFTLAWEDLWSKL